MTDNDGNPILTTPILVLTKPLNQVKELNKITNKIEVKDRIASLKAGVSTIALEQGSEFFTDDSEEQPLIKEDLVPRFSGIKFGPVYENSILRIHSHHYPQLEPVFSGQDVLGMGYFYKQKKLLGSLDADNITSILVSNLGIFALKVTDPVKAKQFSDKLVITAFVDAFVKAYDKKVRDRAYEDCSCSLPSVEYEKLLSDYLVDFLNDQNTGLTIYSANLGIDGNYSWSVHPKYN